MMTRPQITDSKMLAEYIHGDRAVMQLVGPAGTSHTYLFARPRNADDFPPDIRFVYVIHEDKHFYIGMLEGKKFRCTAHSRFSEDCESVKGAHYIVKLAYSQTLLNKTPMKLYQSGYCARCGRELGSKFGYAHGFGKSCWMKHITRREMEEALYANSRFETVQ